LPKLGFLVWKQTIWQPFGLVPKPNCFIYVVKPKPEPKLCLSDLVNFSSPKKLEPKKFRPNPPIKWRFLKMIWNPWKNIWTRFFSIQSLWASYQFLDVTTEGYCLFVVSGSTVMKSKLQQALTFEPTSALCNLNKKNILLKLGWICCGAGDPHRAVVDT
jgi:hypothetical protein